MIYQLSFTTRLNTIFNLIVTISICSTLNIYGQCDSECTVVPFNSEFKALEDFYCSTDGDNWINNDGWFEAINFGTNCNYCEWYGILCDEDEHVISIDLDGLDSHSHSDNGGNQLTGSISSSIIDLEYLEKLYLSNNNLGDTLTSDLFGIPNLEYLDLSYNSYNGEIPSSINGHFYELLDLSHNSFTGIIPVESYGFGGEIVNFSHNQLEGELPLIDAFDLYLQNNNFSGSLDIIESYTFVENINLSNNQFTGEIPKSVSSLIYAHISFSNNDLSGCFPQNLVTFCENNKLKIHGNPKLPWLGNLNEFCETIGIEQFQYGAPCNDGDDSNGITDVIQKDCTCGPMLVSTKNLKDQIELFPIPTNGIINIGSDVEAPLEFWLFDVNGILIRTEKLNGHLIDISNLKNGVYILEISFGGGKIIVDKIIKN